VGTKATRHGRVAGILCKRRDGKCAQSHTLCAHVGVRGRGCCEEPRHNEVEVVVERRATRVERIHDLIEAHHLHRATIRWKRITCTGTGATPSFYLYTRIVGAVWHHCAVQRFSSRSNIGQGNARGGLLEAMCGRVTSISVEAHVARCGRGLAII